MLKVCVYVSVPGCVYGQHMCPQAIFHPAASAESVPLRLLPMFTRAELPGVLPSKQEDFYRLRVATGETARGFHVKDTHCALGTQLEIQRKETLFSADETDV